MEARTCMTVTLLAGAVSGITTSPCSAIFWQRWAKVFPAFPADIVSNFLFVVPASDGRLLISVTNPRGLNDPDKEISNS